MYKILSSTKGWERKHLWRVYLKQYPNFPDICWYQIIWIALILWAYAICLERRWQISQQTHLYEVGICPFSLDKNKNYGPHKETQITITECFYNKIFFWYASTLICQWLKLVCVTSLPQCNHHQQTSCYWYYGNQV